MALEFAAAIVWLWPLLLALSLLWPKMRPYALNLLPIAVIPAALVWLLVVLGYLPLGLWADWPDWLLGTLLRLDELGVIWLGLSFVVWGVAALHTFALRNQQAWRYALFFLLSMSGSFGMIFAADAVTFYLAFSLMSLSAWGLVVHEGHAQAIKAGRWYLGLAVLGELLLFVGLVARSAQLGTTDLYVWSYLDSAWWGLVFIWLGLAIKVGVPLLHVWLPLAHPAAPVPASAVLSGVMIKAGALGWLVLLPANSMWASDLAAWLPWLGVFTMLSAALVGLMQTEAKTILAYSSISQMGWVIWGVGLVWQSASAQILMLWVALYAVHHALIKAGLFLSVGWVKYTPLESSRRVWIGLAVVLFALLMAGLPFASGAWLKAELKAQAYLVEDAIPAYLLVMAGIGTTLLMVQFVRRLARVESKPDTEGEQGRLAWLAWLGLLGLAFIWPWWLMLVPNEQGLAQLLGLSADWMSIESWAWSNVTPVLLGLILALAWRIRVHRQYHCPAGDVLLGYEALGVKLAQGIRHYQIGYARLAQNGQNICQHLLQGVQSIQAPALERRLSHFSHFILLLLAVLLLVVLFAWFV